MNDAGIGFSPEGKFKRKLTDKIHNGLKCYEIIDGKVTAISLVSKPANGLMGKIVSEEEMLITGVILLPDKMIYRINPIMGEEYYIYFTIAVIDKIFKDFRNENWTMKELETLFYSYISGKSMKEIALSLDRTQENVENKLNESDRVPLEILRLSNMRMSTHEIADKLGIHIEQLHEMVKKNGGKVVKIEN